MLPKDQTANGIAQEGDLADSLISNADVMSQDLADILLRDFQVLLLSQTVDNLLCLPQTWP